MRLQIQNSQWLMFGFLTGIVLGTIFANTAGLGFREEMGIFGAFVGDRLSLFGGYKRELFWLVWRQRMLEVSFLWLLSLTAVSVMACTAAAAYYGFSLAVVLSMTTMQMGMMGMVGFSCSLIPQYLLYIPFWCLFALRCMRLKGQIHQGRELRVHLLSLLLFLFIFSVGAWMEAYLNPYILQKILIKY